MALQGVEEMKVPPNCKSLLEDDISKDEIIRRLKLIAKAFQEMGQDDTEKYPDLAHHLATEFYMDHHSKDVKLLVACCIADIFRINAPEAPYVDPLHLKHIFMFIISQLRGLEHTQSPLYNRYFYLLENLAWVKSFNICLDLEDNQEIFCNLYKLIFSIVGDSHSVKVKNFMLDMMCPLITEADMVSQELLDVILSQIVGPAKKANKHACALSKELLKRTANAIEPYIQGFFNNVLILGKTSESEVSDYLYDLIYELYQIAPTVLNAVLPQLEFKLKSSEDSERRSVTKLLARMFSDLGSQLATQNPPLWYCFLGRFNDISPAVRIICIQFSLHFLLNQPELVKEIAEPLKARGHDAEENVRWEAVLSIVAAAKKDFKCVPDEILQVIKERTLDKRFKIRKEALQGLGHVYRRVVHADEPDAKDQKRVSWIRNKIMHHYYQVNIEDKLLVERLVTTCLVPYNFPPEEKQKKLFELYVSLDENARKAFGEMFRCQHMMREYTKQLLEDAADTSQSATEEEKVENEKTLTRTFISIARNLADPMRTQDHMKKFHELLRSDTQMQNHLHTILALECTVRLAEECGREILRKMGNPTTTNLFYHCIKALLERISPVLVDKPNLLALLRLVDNEIRGNRELNAVSSPGNHGLLGMQLLLALATPYPGAFRNEESFGILLGILKQKQSELQDYSLQIISLVGTQLQLIFPNVSSQMFPILQDKIKNGTPRASKFSIRAFAQIYEGLAETMLEPIFALVKDSLSHDNPNLETLICALGHLTLACPEKFGPDMKGIVARFIVKEILMQDRTPANPEDPKNTQSFVQPENLSRETKLKIQSMKMLARWLLAIKGMHGARQSGQSTLRLLHTMILHEGDLMERKRIPKGELAALRLVAGQTVLKLATEKIYEHLIDHDKFQVMALLINDPSNDVRTRFMSKLHKGLMSLKLPLQYLSIFSLSANDPVKENKIHAKRCLIQNITKRREMIKMNNSAATSMPHILPDYVLPYTIFLLAHDPDLTHHRDVNALKNIQDCLWFMLEPLMKNESYSYNFFRKMIENIKQCRDATKPNDVEANNKLYCVCDLALHLIMNKPHSIVLKDHPVDPILPKRLYTRSDSDIPNTKMYLPTDFMGGTKTPISRSTRRDEDKNWQGLRVNQGSVLANTKESAAFSYTGSSKTYGKLLKEENESNTSLIAKNGVSEKFEVETVSFDAAKNKEDRTFVRKRPFLDTIESSQSSQSSSSSQAAVSETPPSPKKVREADAAAAATLAGMAPTSTVVMTSDGIMTNNPLIATDASPEKPQVSDGQEQLIMVPNTHAIIQGDESTIHHIDAEQLQQLIQQQQLQQQATGGEGGQMTVVEMQIDVGNGQTSTVGIPVDPNTHQAVVSQGGVMTTLAGLSAVDLLTQQAASTIVTSGTEATMEAQNPSELVFTTMTDANGMEAMTLGPDTQIITTVDGRQLAVRNGVIQGEVQLATAADGAGLHSGMTTVILKDPEEMEPIVSSAEGHTILTNEEGIPVAVTTADNGQTLTQ